MTSDAAFLTGFCTGGAARGQRQFFLVCGNDCKGVLMNLRPVEKFRRSAHHALEASTHLHQILQRRL
jgi:hypothetical protein